MDDDTQPAKRRADDDFSAEAVSPEAVRVFAALQKYRALFNQTTDAVFLMDLDGNHTEVNDRACEMLGYSRAEMFAMSFQELVAPDHHDHCRRVFERLKAGESVPLYELSLAHNEGRLIPTEINIALIHSADGTPNYIQNIVRDLTERKRAEQQKLELALEQEKVGLLTEFGQAASHELRTPLAVISNCIHFMMKLDDPQKREERALIAEQEIGKLKAILDELALLSRLNLEIPLTRTTFDLNELVTQVINRLRRRSEEKRQSLQVRLGAEQLLVNGDREYLSQALTHVIENAIMYTPEEGAIKVDASQRDTWTVVEVQDSGIGISADDMPYIFDYFFKVDPARTAGESRAGLGLALVKQIMALHHGEIEVESTPDIGSVFRLRLPQDIIAG